MTTARALIRQSLLLLGVISSSDPLEAQEADDALQVLNQLLDSWSNERLTIYAVERLNVPLVAGQRVYTWGVPDGAIAHPRPLQVEGAVLSLTGQDLEWPLEPVDQVGYATIADKTMTTLYPSWFWYHPTYPLGQLSLWPVPTEGNVLGLFPWVALRRCASIDTVVTFPPGYERLLAYGLAADQAPMYGKEISQSIAAILAEAKSAVKRQNTRVPALGMDPAYSARQAGDWSAVTGDYLWRR